MCARSLGETPLSGQDINLSTVNHDRKNNWHGSCSSRRLIATKTSLLVDAKITFWYELRFSKEVR